MGIHAYLSPVDTQEGDLEYALMPQRQSQAKQTYKQTNNQGEKRTFIGSVP